MLTLNVTKEGATVTVARVRDTLRCPVCNYTWAVVQELPTEVGWRQRGREERPFDAIIVQPGQSRSGLHYVEIVCDDLDGFLPTGRGKEFIACGEFFVVPAELASWLCPGQQPIIRFRADRPFAHEAIVVGKVDPALLPKPWEKECGRCFRERIAREADYQQGNLFVKREPCRLSPRADGVETVRAREERAQARFFNHDILMTWATSLQRGDIASLNVLSGGEVIISSPDHPGEDIILGPGEYNLYHPWPTWDRD